LATAHPKVDTMTPAALFLLVPLMVDETPQHNHFATSQLPHEAASAFVQGCKERNPFSLDTDNRLCPIFLLVMAGEESRFQLHPQGESWDARANVAQGPFGEWYGGEARTASWISATRHYLQTVVTATRACPEEPIAMLAGERCGESKHHTRRWAQIIRLLHEPIVQPDLLAQP
jgi:hypothetical protein